MIETHRAALAALTAGFESWQRPRVPQLGPRQPGHAWLAQHYKWGLDRLFLKGGHSHAVIVEDDMLFSPGTPSSRLKAYKERAGSLSWQR